MEAKILNELETGEVKVVDLLDLFSEGSRDVEVATVLKSMARQGLVRLVMVGDRSRWSSEDLNRSEAAFNLDNSCVVRVELAE